MPGILLVEDSEIFRDALKEVLKQRFPHVIIEEASNQRTAIEKATALSPDLIVMDIRLPDGDGLSLTKKLIQILPTTKVVILTSYDINEYRQAAQMNGAIGFLIKGEVTSEELMDEVERILKMSEPQNNE